MFDRLTWRDIGLAIINRGVTRCRTNDTVNGRGKENEVD